MAWLPRRFGLLLTAYLAIMGYVLVAWLPAMVDRYLRLAKTHPQLGRLYLTLIVLGGLALGGVSLWLLYRLWRNAVVKHRRSVRRTQNPSEMSPAEKQAELQDNLAVSREFSQDAQVSAELRKEIERGLAKLEEKQGRCRLEIVAFGTISSGKSSLLNALAGRDVFTVDVVGGTTENRMEIPWPGADEVVLVDTPGLAEVRGESRAAEAAAAARNADLVLLVVDGPLKVFEVDLAEVLAAMEKRVVVCLNKEDWYDAEQQQALLDQLAEQLPGISPADIVAVRARSVTRERIRITPDGREQQEHVDLPANIQPLAERMLEIVEHDGRDLLLANLLLQSRGLVDQAKNRVRAVLDAQANEIINRHMWAAGAATGANPIPLLDIAGGSAVTVNMVLQLARIYKQPIDADTVVKMLEQLGKNLIAMVGATAATPAVVGAIASLMKTVPGVGTVAGGLIQGLVQAVVTRWIGNVFVVYFHQEMKPPPGGLAELARDQWQQLTRPESLRRLIQLGRQKIPASQPCEEQ